jgi:hypothetical protein
MLKIALRIRKNRIQMEVFFLNWDPDHDLDFVINPDPTNFILNKNFQPEKPPATVLFLFFFSFWRNILALDSISWPNSNPVLDQEH